jgi:hypothetical protein
MASQFSARGADLDQRKQTYNEKIRTLNDEDDKRATEAEALLNQYAKTQARVAVLCVNGANAARCAPGSGGGARARDVLAKLDALVQAGVDSCKQYAQSPDPNDVGERMAECTRQVFDQSIFDPSRPVPGVGEGTRATGN